METFPVINASSAVLVPCGPGCRHAEPLRGEYADWVWCHRAGATERVKHMGSDCRWFDATDSIPQHSAR